MNEPTVDSLAWSPRKLGSVIFIAVVIQLTFLFWFSAHGPMKSRKVDVGPAIQLLAEARDEWLVLTDPTIFSRAHPAGFSGVAWLSIPPHSYLPGDKADAPLWLALAPDTLGTTYRDFVKALSPDGFSVRSWPPPAITIPSRLPVPPAFISQLRVEGALAERGIVSQPELPAWTNAEVLAPSRVHVLVDARGNPISAVVLSSSGLPAADQSAVRLAGRMRFGSDTAVLKNPDARSDDGLAAGWVIFSWKTLASATNGSVNPR